MGLASRINNPLVIFSLFLLACLILYQSSVIRFANLWLEDGYSHGFLLLAVCIYIFYERWTQQKTSVVINSSFTGVLVVAFLSIIWAVATLTFVEKIELIGFMLLFPALLMAIFGWQQSKKFFFPFFLLLFAAPVVELFNDVFRKATALLSGAALEITGLTVFVDGFLIQIPVGLFEVDTGCSGIRVVTVGMILSLLYVYMNRLTVKQSIIVVGLGFVCSFLSNIIRVYMIVVAGHLTRMQHPWIEDHANLGWVVFAVVMAIYYYFLYKFYPSLQKTASESGSALDAGPIEIRNANSRKVSLGLLACLFAIVSGPAMAYYLSTQGKETIPENYGLPAQLGSLIKKDAIANGWLPEYKYGKGDYFEQALYQDGNRNVNVHIRRFLQQSPDNEAINVNNRVYQRGVWSEVSSRILSDYNNESLPFSVEETEIHKGATNKMLVWRWYETNARKTGDSRIAKLYNLWGMLNTRQSITVYILAVEKEDNLNLGREKMAATLRSLETTRLIKN